MINKLADLDITDMNINEQIKKTIHMIGDGLHWFSEKYREFKDDVLGMISHKKSLITIFGHKHKILNFIKKFVIFYLKN